MAMFWDERRRGSSIHPMSDDSKTTENRRRQSRSMLVVSGGVLLSRVFGFLRDIVFASVWGTGLGMAVWVAAFRIPNLARALFGEGSFTSAFVPVFSETLEKQGKVAAWRAACRVVSVLALVLGGGAVLTAAICYALLPFFHSELYRQTLLLTPLFMPYAVLICVAVAFGGVLNSFRRFSIPALTPLILNLFLILAAGLVWLCFDADTVDTGIWVLVPAVLLAGIVHVWVHVRVARKEVGEPFRFEPAWRAPEVKKVATLMAPTLLGTGLIQFNIVLDTIWASILGPAALASLYFSQRIIYLPVGLFGVAAGVVSLPSMSQAWVRGERGEFRGQLAHSLRSVLFMCLPMTALLIVLADPIVRLAYQRGSFGEQSVRDTLWALFFYLPGIPFFSLVKPMANAFYARQDTRTPVRITWACLILNVILNLTLMWTLKQGGLALSTTLCSLLNLTALVVMFRRQTGMDIVREIWQPATRMVAATCVAVIAACLALWATAAAAPALAETFSPRAAELAARILKVAVPLGVGYAAYAAAALAFRCEELGEVFHGTIGRLFRRPPAAR